MKKNKMMRLASVLLIAVMVSTSAISGTYAKYVTEGFVQDNARVAKFGVEVEANADMFSKTYKDAYTDDALAMTVESSNENDVVAPGTEGTLAAYNIKGQPEVDVRVSYKVNDFTMANWAVDTNKDGTTDEVYCPIVFTISKNGVEEKCFIGDGIAHDIIELVNEVTEKIDTYYVDYNANEDIGTDADNDLVISWKWHFEGKGDDAGNSGPACQYDAKDTMLGDQAAFDDGIDPATISIKVTCTVTQLD